jgi:hypothetical protein
MGAEIREELAKLDRPISRKSMSVGRKTLHDERTVKLLDRTLETLEKVHCP